MSTINLRMLTKDLDLYCIPISLYNKSIKLNDGEFSGIAKGINEEGSLLLELGSREVKAFPSG